jgi:hypothetical protein
MAARRSSEPPADDGYIFEGRGEPLISTRAFALRLARSLALTMSIAAVSLLIGAVGYRLAGDLPWVDAFLNASMILTGMGPVDHMTTTPGKLFAAGYALYSGIAFISMVGVLVVPVIHRVVHRFHVDTDDD